MAGTSGHISDYSGRNLAVMNDAEARAETIRNAISNLAIWQKAVIEAYQKRDWEALGYDSWPAYVEGEFGDTADLLGKEQRKLVIAAMVEAEMSTRAIAAATGVNQSTVSRATAVAAKPQVMHDASPEPGPKPWANLVAVIETTSAEFEIAQPGLIATVEATPVPRKVTGIDGKTYTATPARRTPNRPALPAQLELVANDLFKLTTKVEKLRADDRCGRNKAGISDRCVPQIRRAVEVLQDFLDYLGEDDEVAS